MAVLSNRETLQALLEDVWIEVNILETNIAVYQALFRDREAAAALHATAPDTFRVLGVALTDAILLGTHRLLDVGAQRGRRTASIETLLAHLPPEDASLRRELKKILAALRVECDDLAYVRHRLIAHRDYNVALEPAVAPARVKARSLKAAITGFARILTAVSNRCGFNLAYDEGDVRLDVDRLIARLQSANDVGSAVTVDQFQQQAAVNQTTSSRRKRRKRTS